MKQEYSQVNPEMHIAPPRNYSEAIQLAQIAKRLCFVTFSCPDNDDLPGDFETHRSLVDDCPEGIEDYPWEDIAFDLENPDWHYVGERIRDIIDKARWNHDAVFVLLDMEKSISNKEISNLLTKLFAPVVEEKLDNFILPERIFEAIKADMQNR